ncbi:MAG TPA: hypothetical protein H9881_07645 [Candidatus Stackebrandtia excrementipullorum]|nr:hypothetical protein [Candidatus Stackebrandtia excrementipullorum]
MQVVRGKRLVEFEAAALEALVAQHDRVLIDVGTGDARTAYRIAKSAPERLVIGVDPAWRRMEKVSNRAMSKPAKGGLGNLLLINSAVENTPPPLHGLADEVLVQMPWGRLLHGVVTGETEVCAGLRTIAAAGASLDVTVGTSIWRPPVPRDIQGLPELTREYVDERLSQRFAEHGWRVEDAGVVDDVVRSSWSSRLGSSKDERVFGIRAVAVSPVGGAASGDL